MVAAYDVVHMKEWPPFLASRTYHQPPKLGRDRSTGATVALKRVILHNEVSFFLSLCTWGVDTLFPAPLM